jgi:hypothetical protein
MYITKKSTSGIVAPHLTDENLSQIIFIFFASNSRFICISRIPTNGSYSNGVQNLIQFLSPCHVVVRGFWYLATNLYLAVGSISLDDLLKPSLLTYWIQHFNFVKYLTLLVVLVYTLSHCLRSKLNIKSIIICSKKVVTSASIILLFSTSKNVMIFLDVKVWQ